MTLSKISLFCESKREGMPSEWFKKRKKESKKIKRKMIPLDESKAEIYNPQRTSAFKALKRNIVRSPSLYDKLNDCYLIHLNYPHLVHC